MISSGPQFDSDFCKSADPIYGSNYLHAVGGTYVITCLLKFLVDITSKGHEA